MKAGYIWLFSASLMMFGCEPGDGGGGGEVTTAEGSNYQFVANRIVLPTITSGNQATYSFDLNGDNVPENKLGAIISGLSSGLSLNVQPAVDAAVTAGQAILLFNVQSTDANLASATNVGTTVYLGNQQTSPAPKYDGTDTLTVDTAVTGGQFLGRIAGNRFSSNAPATTARPVTVEINLPIASAGATLRVRLNGGHIQWRSTGTTGLMEGQVNGSLRVSELQTTVIPGVAALLNGLVAAGGSTATQVLDIFDIGGCTGATADDGQIAVCEVATNPLLQTILAPDVQVYASNGTTYQPCRQNCTNDSISIGVGFTAVRATFNRPSQ